jgi:hypothetical protein
MVWCASYRSDGSSDGWAKFEDRAKDQSASEAALIILENLKERIVRMQ